MKLKDIKKIMELISERLDTQYDIKANWEELESNDSKIWKHRDSVFEISVFYWTHRETNRGTKVVKPVANRDASIVIAFTDIYDNYVQRTIGVALNDGIKIPEDNVDQVTIYTHTDTQVSNHHVASYGKKFLVQDRNANLDDWEYNGGRGYMNFIWEIFDGKGVS